jgi:hypothetical protein
MAVGFQNITTYVDADITYGQTLYSSFIYSLTSPCGATWLDMSYFGGSTTASTYTGSALTATIPTANSGIYVGPDVSPAGRFLTGFNLYGQQTAIYYGPYAVHDILLYYPGIDATSILTQTMTNVSILPRYTTGSGVKMMVVNTSGAAVATGTIAVTYTNQAGVGSRTSFPVKLTTASAGVGNLLSCGTNNQQFPSDNPSQLGPYIPLQSGDTGVRSIESVILTGTNTGTMAVVLVYPLLMTTVTHDVNTVVMYPSEKSYGTTLPVPIRVYDGAVLNCLGFPNGNISSGRLIGDAKFVWN